MFKRNLTIKEYREFQDTIRYGSRVSLNVAMYLLVGKFNCLDKDFFNEYLSHDEDQIELLFFIPKGQEYRDLFKLLITELFGTKGFSRELISKFLPHFSDCPEVLRIYFDLERIRIHKINHSSFA